MDRSVRGHQTSNCLWAGLQAGTFLGITIEQRLAFGLQVVSLFTRNGAELAKGLISAGYRVAKVEGQNHEEKRTIGAE